MKQDALHAEYPEGHHVGRASTRLPAIQTWVPRELRNRPVRE